MSEDRAYAASFYRPEDSTFTVISGLDNYFGGLLSSEVMVANE